MPGQDQGPLHYVEVTADCFEKRGLRRYAGVWSLWARGVGTVISGDFFGWNVGLGAGTTSSRCRRPATSRTDSRSPMACARRRTWP